jgi:tetratricopeptide (TPR) repeat protein
MNIIRDLWGTAYQSLNRFNSLIDHLEKSQEDWAAKYVIYARVYRAFLYLNLVEWWGDVPLITTPPSIEDNPDFRRTSQDEILDFIISELENTCPVLPENAIQAECTRYFANVILARAYLYKADFDKALSATAIIINSGKYALNENVNAIYAGNSAESIFELPGNEEYTNSLYLDLIQKGDFMPVCRYAEILLMATEANYKAGRTDQSLLYLNQIRTRQGLAQISSVTEDTLLDAWQSELQNEGLWFFTLKRFGKATQILNIPEYKLLLPVPLREIESMPSITQNPGW